MWKHVDFLRDAFRNTPKLWWVLSFGIWGYIAYVLISGPTLHSIHQSIAAHWQLLVITAVVLLFFSVVGGASRTLQLKEKSYRAQIKELESRLSQLSAILNQENKVYPDREPVLQDKIVSLLGNSLLSSSSRHVADKLGIPMQEVEQELTKLGRRGLTHIAGILKNMRK